MVTHINTQDLLELLPRTGLVLIDTRVPAAFNGWKLNGEARGGHIRGAVNVPISWMKLLSEPETKALLDSKGISTDKTLVIYGYRGEMDDALDYLPPRLGYEDVRIYGPGLNRWADDANLPMEHLENYEKLVHPRWVYELTHRVDAQTREGRDYAIIEAGSGEPAAYTQGHIPGAIYLDLNSLEREPSWNILTGKELEGALLAHGITHEKTIVLYGRSTAAAARAALILMVAGVRDVRILDGGMEAWTSAGYKVETNPHEPTPAKAFGRRIPAHPEYILDINEVYTVLGDSNAALVSVRSWEEYIGKSSGYDYIQTKGHIAGSVWAGLSGTDVTRLEGYRNVDHTTRDYQEIARIWGENGITPDKKISFYCGTGWRASEAFFYAYLMGWKDISVYDGGWLEWSQNPDNPIEVGTSSS